MSKFQKQLKINAIGPHRKSQIVYALWSSVKKSLLTPGLDVLTVDSCCGTMVDSSSNKIISHSTLHTPDTRNAIKNKKDSRRQFAIVICW